MALSATIIKADLQISDLNQHYYQAHSLTVAQHPSETDERLMIRIIAYALNAYQTPEFSKGLSATDEPDIWKKDLSGHIEHWISLGQADPNYLKKACHQSERVSLYCYGRQGVETWWQKHRSQLITHTNLSIHRIPYEASQALNAFYQRPLQLSITMDGKNLMISNDSDMVQIELESFKDFE